MNNHEVIIKMFSEYSSSHINTKETEKSCVWWELLGFTLLVIFIYNIQQLIMFIVLYIISSMYL